TRLSSALTRRWPKRCAAPNATCSRRSSLIWAAWSRSRVTRQCIKNSSTSRSPEEPEDRGSKIEDRGSHYLCKSIFYSRSSIFYLLSSIFDPQFNRRVPKSLRRHSGRLTKNFGEMALARVADLGADLGDRQIALGQQPTRPLDPQGGQIGVRRRAGDLFEEPREMEFAQIGRSGDFGQAEFAPTIGAHKFNGAAQPAVDNPYARQLNLVRPLRVDVRPEQVNRELIDERAYHFAPARVPAFDLGRDRFERGAQLRVSGQRRQRRAEGPV